MKYFISSLKKFFLLKESFILYLYPATVGALSDFLFFELSYLHSKSVLIANTIGFIIGTSVNFLLCRYYVFKSDSDYCYRLLLTFLLTCLVVILMANFIVFMSKFIDVHSAKILSFPFSYVLNYILRAYVIFKTKG